MLAALKAPCFPGHERASATRKALQLDPDQCICYAELRRGKALSDRKPPWPAAQGSGTSFSHRQALLMHPPPPPSLLNCLPSHLCCLLSRLLFLSAGPRLLTTHPHGRDFIATKDASFSSELCGERREPSSLYLSLLVPVDKIGLEKSGEVSDQRRK